jgi:hypothetical protein
LGPSGCRTLVALAIERHLVGPLLWTALKEIDLDLVPNDVQGRLQAEARRATLHAVAAKAETMRIALALNEQGIEPVLLKGWALEQELSRDIGQRTTLDLDIMIGRHELAAAANLLQGTGYVCEQQNILGSRERLDFFFRFAHHLRFTRAYTVIELHIRPLVNPRLLPLEFVSTELRTITLNGVEVRYRVLSAASLLLYLALHGFGHGWVMAKWLTDFPPLVAKLSDIDWVQVSARAKDLSVEKAVGVALSLSRDLLHMPIPEAAAPLLERAEDAYVTALSYRHLTGAVGLHGRRSPWRWVEDQLLMLSISGNYLTAASQLRMGLVRPSDVVDARMPDKLLPLQYVLCPIKWPFRKTQQLYGGFVDGVRGGRA